MKLKERFLRWRASRGYGVHSPSAFKIVTRVVRPPRGTVYYGEERLYDFFSTAKGVSRREYERAKLLLRFVAEKQPSFVWITPKLPVIYREAIGLAGCVVRILDGSAYPLMSSETDMVVADSCRIKANELKKFLKPGKSLIGFSLSQSFIKTAIRNLSGGLAIEGVESLIAVCTAHQAVHKYEVSKF